MAQKPPTIHLKISIDNKIYVIGTLSYNLKKQEVSFYFHRPKSLSETILNIDTGEIIDPIHHITWHEKLMQIRTRKKILHRVFYPTGSLFPKNKTVVPMFVDGIYLNGESGILIEDSDLVWKTNSDEVLLLHKPAPTNFSLIFLLAPNDWVTRDVLLGSRIEEKNGKEIPLFLIRTESSEIGRIKCFENWDMIITTTPYVPPTPHS